MNIKKASLKIASGFLSLVMLLTLAVSSVSAAEILTKNDCLAAGGTWTSVKGMKTCETTTGVNTTDPNPPGFTATLTTTTTKSQKGAIGAPGTLDTYSEVITGPTLTGCTNSGGNPVPTNNPNCSGWY